MYNTLNMLVYANINIGFLGLVTSVLGCETRRAPESKLKGVKIVEPYPSLGPTCIGLIRDPFSS